jgi:hypothetical protein
MSVSPAPSNSKSPPNHCGGIRADTLEAAQDRTVSVQDMKKMDGEEILTGKPD